MKRVNLHFFYLTHCPPLSLVTDEWQAVAQLQVCRPPARPRDHIGERFPHSIPTAAVLRKVSGDLFLFWRTSHNHLSFFSFWSLQNGSRDCHGGASGGAGQEVLRRQLFVLSAPAVHDLRYPGRGEYLILYKPIDWQPIPYSFAVCVFLRGTRLLVHSLPFVATDNPSLLAV